MDILRVRIESVGRQLIRSGGAANSQVDTARRDGVQDAELLCNFQRRIVRQHDAGAADTDTRRGGGDRRHEYLGGGADDITGVVMLRYPVAMVTQRVAMSREIQGLTDRIALRSALGRGRLIEY